MESSTSDRSTAPRLPASCMRSTPRARPTVPAHPRRVARFGRDRPRGASSRRPPSSTACCTSDRRRQAVRVRRGREDQLLRHTQDVRATLDCGNRRRGWVVTCGRERRCLHRVRRRQALRVRRGRVDELFRHTEDVRAAVDRDDDGIRCVVFTRGRQRCRVGRIGREQGVRLRCQRKRRLLRDTEDLRCNVDRDDK